MGKQYATRENNNKKKKSEKQESDSDGFSPDNFILSDPHTRRKGHPMRHPHSAIFWTF
jgi:hypothetical protein